MSSPTRVAYFSMEIALRSEIPTYAGGLGVLAGDTLRAAAAQGVPMVGVTLLHREGYFKQSLDAEGWQCEQPDDWAVEQYLTEEDARASLELAGRGVELRAWRLDVESPGGFEVPVFLLDTRLPGNTDWDQTLTDDLYGGDDYYRLCQEVILGIGGVRMLRALGYEQLEYYHMNEGHSSFLVLELLEEERDSDGAETLGVHHIERVRDRCVFTTHTPVPAGHDKFPMNQVRDTIGDRDLFHTMEAFQGTDLLNMTYLALNLSAHINGVSKRHREVSQLMFAPFTIESVTNGVHLETWMSDPMQSVLAEHINDWREDPTSLRSALNLPRDRLWEAHARAKRDLLRYVHEHHAEQLDPTVFTVGFARRATSYKRPTLIFRDLDRLRGIADRSGPFQLVFAGKAHPRDTEGKRAIQEVFRHAERLRGEVQVVYLEDYDMDLARRLVAGVDLWLNTPHPPMEASGTSGMKAALNGVPSLSVNDGWWLEGGIEGVTGWGIGPAEFEGDRVPSDNREQDAEELYEKLGGVILPLFYGNREEYIEVMRHCIGVNGSFFNARRMVRQYILKVYGTGFTYL